MADDEVEDVARQVAGSISERMPTVISQLLQRNFSGSIDGLRLDCNVTLGSASCIGQEPMVQVISVDVGSLLRQFPSRMDTTTIQLAAPTFDRAPLPPPEPVGGVSNAIEARNFGPRSTLVTPAPTPEEQCDEPPLKTRKATGGLRVVVDPNAEPGSTGNTARRLESAGRVFPQRKKNVGDNPVFQPSSLQKFVKGVFESIYSSLKMDPTEVIEQWQAIESNGQPKLLTSTESELAARDSPLNGGGTFGRMSILARKLTQTSRTCRSLEVIVQAKWVQLFDDRVHELSASMSKEKAKKSTISEACLDFNWTEKELRNRMGVWRGYQDIQKAGGWAALVFAGMGLYRFCKYRVSFNEETFQALRALRHRFEVAADTLHPRWRHLLGIVGASTERKYTGHPHDYVIGMPNNEAVPLSITYQQWDKDFSFIHLDTCQIDEDAWGLYDPRVVHAAHKESAHTCQICHERQSDDPPQNNCSCFPNLYPQTISHNAPVQVYRTPNGRNNGLVACLPFDRGTAVGEFVGQVTSGLSNLDVMVGQTESASYQIWQGRQGNYTRFVNHSCQPNSQYERFMWMGTQRIVLVSKGIEAGEEITVDYSDTYWKVSLQVMPSVILALRLTICVESRQGVFVWTAEVSV